VEIYSKAKHVIDDYIIWRVLTAHWITEATHTHTEREREREREYVTLACPVEYDSE
jgi:hypothetical protein